MATLCCSFRHRAELSKSQKIPRDMVFVLDTSGSMRGKRMTQARDALKYCLEIFRPTTVSA